MTGALTSKQVGQSYGHYLILLLMGGFIISQAMEKSGTHKRLAFGMLTLFGGKGKRIVFGFMAASALLSMWISNTATTLMLLPIALAVISQKLRSKVNCSIATGNMLCGQHRRHGDAYRHSPKCSFCQYLS